MAEIINTLIPHLPFINRARGNNYSFKEIISILKSEYNLEVNDIALKNFYHKHKSDKLKLEYKRIKCFSIDHKRHFNISEYIIFMNSFCITNNKNHISKLFEINEKNIHTIENPVARIYAKWFTRNFHIDNSKLIQIVSNSELDEINLIPKNIDDKFKSILKELLLTNLKNHDEQSTSFASSDESGITPLY